ncbi:MAG TPA: flavodoxin family protein [Devosia sp.]|jgi:flavodoxin|nr:flavodoxin family protein [Devosia sp.]
MKALVVYDTAYGNTARIAEAIARGIGPDAHVHSIRTLAASDLPALDLLVVGSPTQGGRPTDMMMRWLKALGPGRLEGIAAAAFDTRVRADGRGLALRLLMKLMSYAAPRIADALRAAGARRVEGPEGFYVEGREGPLQAGEKERARAWGKILAGQFPLARTPEPLAMGQAATGL